jgi:hypothetical protein
MFASLSRGAAASRAISPGREEACETQQSAVSSEQLAAGPFSSHVLQSARSVPGLVGVPGLPEVPREFLQDFHYKCGQISKLTVWLSSGTACANVFLLGPVATGVVGVAGVTGVTFVTAAPEVQNAQPHPS